MATGEGAPGSRSMRRECGEGELPVPPMVQELDAHGKCKPPLGGLGASPCGRCLGMHGLCLLQALQSLDRDKHEVRRMA